MKPSNAQIRSVVHQTMEAFLVDTPHVCTWMRCEDIARIAALDFGMPLLVRAADRTLVDGTAMRLGPLKSLHIEMEGPVLEHVRVFYREQVIEAYPFVVVATDIVTVQEVDDEQPGATDRA